MWKRINVLFRVFQLRFSCSSYARIQWPVFVKCVLLSNEILERAFLVHGDGGRAISRKIESMEFMRAGQTRARKSRTPYITLGLEWTFIFCQQHSVFPLCGGFTLPWRRVYIRWVFIPLFVLFFSLPTSAGSFQNHRPLLNNIEVVSN